MDIKTELPKIKEAAEKLGIDWAFVAAIREAENGSPGREFGVLSVGAPTYDDQLKITCNTISHRLMLYPGNPLTADPFKRIKYNDRFIAYFASIWAPVGAANDPNGLNINWSGNVKAIYERLIAEQRKGRE
jgi:hypothetical protein